MKFLLNILFIPYILLTGPDLLGQVNKTNLKIDITYLASDELGGRQTGSEGEKKSAEYIANEFAKLNLKKLSPNYFQKFEFVNMRLATNQCEFSLLTLHDGVKRGTMVLFKDYYPISLCSNTDSAEGELIDVGYGIISEKEKRNDFEAIGGVEGKVCLIRTGFAEQAENPHSPLADVSSLSQKIQNCIKYGAVGIIFKAGNEIEEIPKGELDPFTIPLNIPIFYLNKDFFDGIKGMKCKLKAAIFAPLATAHNVIGFKNNRKRKTVVIMAHHDHLGIAEYGHSLHTGPSEIHNGADDNASGVATILELARTLKGKKYNKTNYLFIAVSGEEIGLLGSKYYVEHPLIKLKKIKYVINIDMLGRLDTIKNTLIVNGVGTTPQFPKTIEKLNSNKLNIVTSESGFGASDHTSFYLKNIPSLHFFTGQHSDYHKPSDDESLINYAGMEKCITYIQDFIAVNNKIKKMPFTKTNDVIKGVNRWKVSMGIMPDYTFGGVGIRIDGVSDEKPAKIAGLEKGDVIQKMGETVVMNMNDYMIALTKLKKGDKVMVTVKRKEDLIIKEVQF